MLETLASWAPWAGLIAAAGGLFGWAIGVPAVLNIVSKLVDIFAPLARMAVEMFVDIIKWAWNNIIFVGLKDIFDQWATIATVVLMGFLLWGWLDLKVDDAVDSLAQCQTEVTKLKKQFKVSPPTGSDWFWPLFR